MEAITFFADKNNAVAYFAARRWPDGVACPACASKKVTAIKTRQLWQCKDCRKQFSVKVGTIFEDSPLALGKWLTAYWLLTNCRNGISSYEIARHLGITQKTAWFMAHRIRETLKSGSFLKLSGTVEADETFIGGSDTNRHANKKNPRSATLVLGMIERGGRPVAKVVDSRKARDLKPAIRENVEQGSILFTDELKSYNNLHGEYYRDTVNHDAGQFVKGDTHTNTIENYWSLVKRMIKGTYIHVSDFHLDRYLDEQGTRYEVRKQNEHARFDSAISGAPGRRLTYAELTGKVQAA